VKKTILLQMLLVILAARGLPPDALTPWRTWVTFKHYARLVDEVPDPGVSVQLIHVPSAGESRLFLLRQAVEPCPRGLEPIGGMVCERAFPLQRRRSDWALWSFDLPSFDRFVDLAEQTPAFTELLLMEPLRTAVYWETA